MDVRNESGGRQWTIHTLIQYTFICKVFSLRKPIAMLTAMTEPSAELKRVASDLSVMRTAIGDGPGLTWAHVAAFLALAAMGALSILLSLFDRGWTRPTLLASAVMLAIWWILLGRKFQADQSRDPATWRAFRKEALAALIIAPFAVAYGYWARYLIVGNANWTMQSWAQMFAAPLLMAAAVFLGVQAVNDPARRFQFGFAVSALATAFWLPFTDDRYLALGVMLLVGGLVSGMWLARDLKARERADAD